MANTLNLGTDGNWATKEDSLLGYNSENGNFKPLAFNFTRASSATVVNKAGLIETVGSGEPRIDFNNDANGALLLEPTRLQKIQYSEAFDNSYWIKPQASVIGGQSSPMGNNSAFKLVEDNSNNFHWLLQSSALNASGTWSYSIFAKAGERDYISMGNASSSFYSFFDLQNGTVVSSVANAVGSIEAFKNGWYRCTVKLTTTVGQAIGVFISTDGSTINYQGDGTSGIYVAMAQLEQGSYATSYIPTQGSAVTRVADSSSQTVPSGVIGQTEGGVIYMDFIAQNTGSSSQSHFFLGSAGSEIGLYGGNQFIFYSSGGVSINGGSVVTGQRYKVAFGYETNDYVAYINGVQVGIDTSGTYPTMSSIFLNSYSNGTEIQKKEIKDFKLYNTRLSNAELQALTTL